MLLTTHLVDADTYRAALARARDNSELIREMTSDPDEISNGGRFFLSNDGQSGFMIRYNGHLCGLFSREKGRGDFLMREAISLGAHSLDCFDGYLPAFYSRHGFAITKRLPNWTPGGPDVIFMSKVSA